MMRSCMRNKTVCHILSEDTFVLLSHTNGLGIGKVPFIFEQYLGFLCVFFFTFEIVVDQKKYSSLG